METWFNGLAVDVDGRPIRCGPDWRPGSFTLRAPDPLDPPRFEAQAGYLDRLNLLMAGERRRLAALAFTPEPIVVEDEDSTR